jgi:hypothetical protein
VSWWLLRQHKAFKPVSCALGIIIFIAMGYWFLSQPKQWTDVELSRYIPIKSDGSFKRYSSKDLNNLKLEAGDFSIPLELVQGYSADPRIDVGLLDQYSIKTLFGNGKLVDWDLQVRVAEISKEKNTTLVQTGHVRIADKDWIDFHQVQQCLPRSQTLSSGVITYDLDCKWMSSTEPLDKLDVQESYCSVVPTSYRGKKVSAEYGKYTIKRTGAFSKATKEESVIDGDLICNGKRMGFGQEKTVMVTSPEEPNLIYPGAGNRKILFLLKTVKDQSGNTVFQNRMSLIRSVRPEPLYQEKKRVVRLKNTKQQKKKLARNL